MESVPLLKASHPDTSSLPIQATILASAFINQCKSLALGVNIQLEFDASIGCTLRSGSSPVVIIASVLVDKSCSETILDRNTVDLLKATRNSAIFVAKSDLMVALRLALALSASTNIFVDSHERFLHALALFIHRSSLAQW